MKHNYKKLDIVVSVIKDYPDAANDDPLLYAKYWELEGWDYNKSIYDNLSNLTRPETITRRRRQAHTLGLITYSDQALKSRTEAYKKEQNTHSVHEQAMAAIVKPKYIEKIVDGERIIIVA